MMKILIAGELNVDLVLQNCSALPRLGKEVLAEDASPTLGGASAICAAGLARLGNRVGFVSKVGTDVFGDFCVGELSRFNIDISTTLRDSFIKTGITVSISCAQDRALVTYLGSIAALRASDISEATLGAYCHLHISSFFLQQELRPDLKSLFASAHRHGLTTSLDPGFDPSEQWGSDIVDVLSEVDIFLPNEVELELITGVREKIQALRALQNGRTMTVVKLGPAGCMAIEKDDIVSVPAFPVKALDTTGAGDSFNAGFLHSWLGEKNLKKAMRFGAACGALSTQRLGGTANQPSESEVNQFLRQTRESIESGT
ncbi:MAG: carbohydrate kinase family protein [Terriglobales bacterium]